MTRVRAERLRRNWTQVQLGKAARLAGSEIGRIETGMSKGYPCQLQRLAAALEIPPDSLMDEVELQVVPPPKQHRRAKAAA